MVKYQLKHEWLLSAEFAAVVQEIAEAFDGLVIPLASMVVYTHERTVAPEKFPAAELLGIGSSPVGESSAQRYHHAIDVMWTMSGHDEDTIVKQLEGLILATRRFTFRRTLPMGDYAAPIIPGGEDYGPLVSSRRGQAQPLVKAAVIRLTVPTFAD